jgi:hypothetical protein
VYIEGKDWQEGVKMQNQRGRVGLVLFWAGAVYTVVAAGLGGWGEPPLIARLSQALNIGPAPFFLWAFSVPLGALLTGVGMLLHTQAKPSRISMFAIGVFVAVLFVDFLLRGFLLSTDAHFPPFFGLAGASTLVLFLALVWFWARRRKTLEDSAKASADLQLVGYVFFILATWFLCGNFSIHFSEDLTRFTPRSPVDVMIYLVLGWLFLFLSHYKARPVERAGAS